MEQNKDQRLTLEKLEIHKRLLLIEEYIKEGKDQRAQINSTMTTLNVRATNLENMIHGDPKGIDKMSRDGINRRVEAVEKDQADDKEKEKEIKGNFLKIAVGAITMAVGAFVLYLFKLIWGK